MAYINRPSVIKPSTGGSSSTSIARDAVKEAQEQEQLTEQVKQQVASTTAPTNASSDYDGQKASEQELQAPLTPFESREKFIESGKGEGWFKEGDETLYTSSEFASADNQINRQFYSNKYGWFWENIENPSLRYFNETETPGWAQAQTDGSFSYYESGVAVNALPDWDSQQTEQPSDDDLRRQDIKKANQESMGILKGDISTLESMKSSLDIVNNPDDYDKMLRIDSSLKSKRRELLIAQQLDGDIDTKKFQKDANGDVIKDVNGNPVEEDKWDLKELALLTGLLASGAVFADSIFSLFDDEETEQLDIKDELIKSAEATTDPVLMDKIINASYRDQPRLTDLENLTNYRTTFGSMSGDYFNTEYGPELETKYQEWLGNNPYGNRDQFLVDWAEQNPTNPLSASIRTQMSRLGQMERSGKILAEMDAGLIQDGMNRARDFYKPTEMGGMGFNPSDFRTNDQNALVRKTMGLLNDPEVDRVKQNISARIGTGGKLGADEARDITASSLTSVDSSLANQAYLRDGGLARAVLNNSTAQRKRLREDEASMLGVVQSQQSFLPTANNVVMSNTIDPVKAFGMPGSQNELANNIYASSPVVGQDYNPMNAFASSIIGANANINQANSLNPSTLESVSSTLNNASNFAGSVSDYQNRNKDLNSLIV